MTSGDTMTKQTQRVIVSCYILNGYAGYSSENSRVTRAYGWWYKDMLPQDGNAKPFDLSLFRPEEPRINQAGHPLTGTVSFAWAGDEQTARRILKRWRNRRAKEKKRREATSKA